MFEFKAEDFGVTKENPISSELRYAIDRANAILKAHLDTLPKVYGLDETSMWNPEKQKYQTHSALLFNVQKLEEL